VLQPVLTFALLLLLGFGLDWLITTRLGAYYPTKDYKFSVTARRAGAVVASVLAFTYIVYASDHPDREVGGLAFFAVAIGLYCWMAVLDVRSGLVDIEADEEDDEDG
jgi:hypothetical protein